MRGLRRTATYAALLALLAACAGQPDRAPAEGTASSPSSSPSSTSELTSELTLPTPGGAMSSRTFAEVVNKAMLRSRSARISIVTPGTSGGSVAMTGVSVFHTAIRSDMSLTDGTSDMRLVDDVPYVRSPEQHGGRWEELPKGALPSATAVLGAELTTLSLAGGNPLPADLLEGATVTFVGRKSDRTHFRVRVPGPAFVDYFAKVGDRLYPPVNAADKASRAAWDAADTKAVAGLTAVYEVWLDSGDRPVTVAADTRVFDRLEGRKTTAGALTGQYTWRASQWGAKVMVERPEGAIAASP